jgi:excinuclease ABC subunit A
MLGLMEPLAALFSRSQQALMLGLSSKQFLISSTLRGTGDVCSKCYGAGLVIREVAGFTLPDSAPCPLCAGTRFRAPIADITFKGRTLWQLLNGTIHEALPALRALPKKGSTLKIIEALSLADLPLGLPARLLSPDEHRLLLIVQGILRGTRSHPSLLVVEAASAGFSSQKQRALERLLTCDAPTLLPHTTVVLVEE